MSDRGNEQQKEPSKVHAKVDDEFIHAESGATVKVMKVNKEEGTVDVQEQGGAGRYWGGVQANKDCLLPVK